MDTPFPTPALAAAAPAALQQPALVPEISRRNVKRISEIVNSVVFYGLLAFGLLFPIVATSYALIAY